MTDLAKDCHFFTFKRQIELYNISYTIRIMDYLQLMPFYNEQQLLGEDDKNLFEFEQENRYQELIKFIDEFINAEDTQEYLRRRQGIIKTDASTDTSRDVILQTKGTPIKLLRRTPYNINFKKYPLTKKSVIKYFKMRHEELERSKPDETALAKLSFTIDQTRVCHLFALFFKSHSTVKLLIGNDFNKSSKILLS